MAREGLSSMTERGALKAYAWRRPDPRGWFFVPVGWAVIGLALLLSLGDSPPVAAGIRVVIGWVGMAVLACAALRISGSHRAMPSLANMVGAFAVFLGTAVNDFLPGRIACVVVALAIPPIASLSALATHRRPLPYLYADPPVVQLPARPMTDYGSWSVPAAAGLLDAPVVVVNRWRRQREFVLTDLAGDMIARIREVPHPRADDGMREAFDFQIATAHRYVIRVESNDGEPVFFIDGAEIQIGGTVPNGAGLQRSLAVVRPDGWRLARIGSMFFDDVYADILDVQALDLDDTQYEWFKPMIVNDGKRSVPCVQARRTLSQLARRRYATLLDGDGAAFAQFDYGYSPVFPKVRQLIRFREKTPVALRMAAIAWMITYDDARRKDVLAPDPSAPEPYPQFSQTHAAHYRRLRKFMDDAIAERRQWQAG